MKITDTRPLPNGRLHLPAFGLGGAALGGLFSPVGGDDASATLAAAWAAGVRHFDTAPYYGHTRSERRLGVFLFEQPRGSFVLGAKVGRLMVPDAGAGVSAKQLCAGPPQAQLLPPGGRAPFAATGGLHIAAGRGRCRSARSSTTATAP